jgi:YggT family protein
MVATSLIATIFCDALLVFQLILLARVVVSWLIAFGMRPPVTGPARTAYDLLFDVTEPVLRPIRRIVPPAGPVDVTVLVAFVIILVLRLIVCH